MIVERREYTPDPGQSAEFWAVQRDWYWPPEIGDFFNHLIGYFETIDDPPAIVHLYRFASLADWEARYQALYRRFPPGYFTVVRTLLAAQRNVFMAPAPVDLPCVPPLDRPVGPAHGFGGYDRELPPDLIVEEVTTDLRPGGLFDSWRAIRDEPGYADALRHNLIGLFHSVSGRLHRVFEYRWHSSRSEAVAHRALLGRAAELHGASDRWGRSVIGTTARFLRPAPFGWLRPLFEPMDWPLFEARDPSLRRIASWPAPPA